MSDPLDDHLRQTNALQMEYYLGKISASQMEERQAHIDALERARGEASMAEIRKRLKQCMRDTEMLLSLLENRNFWRTLNEKFAEYDDGYALSA